LDQSRDTTVVFRKLLLAAGEVISVVIEPKIVHFVVDRVRAPVDLNVSDTGLDEPASHEQALPELGHAVTLARGLGFLGQIERLLRFWRGDKAERPLIGGIVDTRVARFDPPLISVNGLEQLVSKV